MLKKYVTPSLLNVDKKLRSQMATNLINEGISWIHYDVMDGRFVKNLAITKTEIENIKNKSPKHFMDAHLMIENPLEVLEQYKDLVDITTFHYEAVESKKLLKFLKDNHHFYRLGLAIKPKTEVKEILKFLPYIQLVLVMSVEPGKGGQKFIENAYEKIKELKLLRNKNSYQYVIQVDGGINNKTGPKCFKLGADACVAGTYLVKEPTKERIKSILK